MAIDWKAKYHTLKVKYQATKKELKNLPQAVDNERDKAYSDKGTWHYTVHTQTSVLRGVMEVLQDLARKLHLDSNVKDCSLCAQHAKAKKRRS